ncbi:PiggyBac transposable element-derived protein 4 [Eumeta japonica]|uniref:PiggyBac transposable element-derived protein 4 n=1 Tax=Eumeta variegata TaxID=151549 RepID=A0A4C1U178_EUMVA|nr:PiggyBac transposable element-derived protein 4 [Eumeta japonica]
MSRGRLSQSPILEELLKEDEEESESELSDQGCETSDHIVAEEPLSAEESNCSDLEEDDLPLSEINSCFTGRDKVTKWQKSNNNRVRQKIQNILTEDADAVEIRALFGLLYIAGSLKISHANLEDLYASDGTGIPIFPITMSVKRVKFLLNSLRFDGATTRQARRTLDKAAPIREVLDMFTQNCLLSTFYVLNIELYAGKQPEGPYQFSNAASDVVKRLITPISGTGRNLTIDNWYTSVPLTNDLAKNYKISVVGTIRKNKKEIPPCFIDKTKPEYSSQFGFSDTATLVSYVPKKKRSVVLISSLHCAVEIDESTNEKRKPSIVTFYNKTKGGVDEVDKKVKMYSVSRKNNRWPLTLFFRLLDIAGINSMVILRANNMTLRKRRMYLRALGTELTKEYVQKRSTMVGLPRKLKRNIREHLNMEVGAADTEAVSSGTCRRTCKICPAKKRRQSKTQLSEFARSNWLRLRFSLFGQSGFIARLALYAVTAVLVFWWKSAKRSLAHMVRIQLSHNCNLKKNTFTLLLYLPVTKAGGSLPKLTSVPKVDNLWMEIVPSPTAHREPAPLFSRGCIL